MDTAAAAAVPISSWTEVFQLRFREFFSSKFPKAEHKYLD